MDLIKAAYKGSYKLAIDENADQKRQAVSVIEEMMSKVGSEETRINALLTANTRALIDTEERVYLELRLMAIEKLVTRLANAKAEVSGIFDIENEQ
ncbi:hypothetical protein [Vreelandella sp. H-I2]